MHKIQATGVELGSVKLGELCDNAIAGIKAQHAEDKEAAIQRYMQWTKGWFGWKRKYTRSEAEEHYKVGSEFGSREREDNYWLNERLKRAKQIGNMISYREGMLFVSSDDLDFLLRWGEK
jgi:hypothetical protein